MLYAQNIKLNKEEEKEYLTIYQTSNNEKLKEEALNKLISNNVALIYSIINRVIINNYGFKKDDLFSYGVEGLIYAASKFNLNTEVKFSTYAYNWINKKVIEGYREMVAVIRLPDYVWDGLTTFTKKMKEVESLYEIEATYIPFSDQNNGQKSIMEALLTDEFLDNPMTLNTYKSVVEAYENRFVLSLDSYFDNGDNDKTLLDTIASNDHNDLASTIRNELLRLSKDNEMLYCVIDLKLQGYKSAEIERKLNITRAKERYLEEKAFACLRNSDLLKEMCLNMA